MIRLRVFRNAVIAVVAITAAGLIWEVTALNVFAKRAGELRGMIANPRPTDDLNYDLTPHGRTYELWAIRVPVLSTFICLFLAGAAGTTVLVLNDLRGRVLALWGLIVLCATVLGAVTVYYLMIATNFFI